MGDSGKRKLSARQILADIGSGMDGPALKRKYGLSDKGFASVLRQLSAAGALTEQAGSRLRPPADPPSTALSSMTTDREKREPRSSHEHGLPRKEALRSIQWRCPACNAPQLSEMSECPACGVVVAKFTAHQRQTNRSPGPLRMSTGVADSADREGWTFVVTSVLVLALIGGAIIAWSVHRSNQKATVASLEPYERQMPVQSERPPESTAIGEPSATVDYPPFPTGDLNDLRVDPPRSVIDEPKKSATEPTKYVTGVLRQFNAGDFKREVVEASKTHPVIFQFYSDT